MLPIKTQPWHMPLPPKTDEAAEYRVGTEAWEESTRR